MEEKQEADPEANV